MQVTKKPSELFADKMVDAEHFRVAVLSDYHMAKDKAEKLKLWYLSQHRKDVNLVIYGGDFDNLTEQSPAKVAENAESEARIAAFLTFLEFFCCPIYYVPGNHEPPTMFKADLHGHSRSLTQFSHNMHLRKESLTAGLSIVGIGGCCPAVRTDVATGEKKNIWEGYPYVSGADYAPDLATLQTLVDESSEQLIFITHCGPSLISTNLAVGKDELVNGGSELVSQFWQKNREKLLLTVHGHMHGAQGMHRDFTATVLNPGSLGQGNFALLDLVRRPQEKTWVVRSVEFVDLNTFD